MNKLLLVAPYMLIFLIVSSCSSVEHNSTKSEAEKFQRVFKEKLPKFKSCYQLQKLREKNKESVIVFDFTMDSEGKAKDAKVSGGGFTVENSVEKCMKDELEKIQFEKPLSEGGSHSIKQPVIFQN
ncbi:MAG: AgmX/PglI C-terminal domain-containing protein [Bacteriovoracaceae bacterium]|nr:AgmX/PglI C-terminal domain-containing protein [Bacteriovoracaceae bacterium]